MAGRVSNVLPPVPSGGGGLDLSGLLGGLGGFLNGGQGGGGELRPQEAPRQNQDIGGLRSQIGDLRNTLQNPTQGQTDRQLNQQFQRARSLADSRAASEQAKLSRSGISGPLAAMMSSNIAAGAAAGVGGTDVDVRRSEALNRQQAEETRRQNLLNLGGLQSQLVGADERGRQFDATYGEQGRQFDADFSLRNDPQMRRLQLLNGLFGAVGNLGALSGGGGVQF